MSELDMELLIKKKPYFQKYVYPKLNREYNDFIKQMELYSLRKYGQEIKQNTYEDFLQTYDTYNPVLDTPSVMNKICHNLEDNIKEIKISRKNQDQGLIQNILIDKDREILLEYEDYINDCLKEYKQFRKNERENINESEKHELNNNNLYILCKHIRKNVYEVIKDSRDVANIVVYVCYNSKVQENKDFVWNVFGKEVLDNVKKNKQRNIYVPVEDKNGQIKYLGKNYSKKEIDL